MSENKEDNLDYKQGEEILECFIEMDTLGNIIHIDLLSYSKNDFAKKCEQILKKHSPLEAVYKPYTDAELKDWIYNEYVKVGWQRRDATNGNAYEVYNTPDVLMNNFYPPHQNPANWRLTY